MAEEMDTGLEAALLYHTQLGCADESATEEEQLEKVLWYHPESDTPAERLERLSLCEGLSAFASAFAAGEAVETVQTLLEVRYVHSLKIRSQIMRKPDGCSYI